MNQTHPLITKRVRVASLVSQFMTDYPLDINDEQLFDFNCDVTELMLERELDNTADNIAKIVRELAEDRGFDNITKIIRELAEDRGFEYYCFYWDNDTIERMLEREDAEAHSYA